MRYTCDLLSEGALKYTESGAAADHCSLGEDPEAKPIEGFLFLFIELASSELQLRHHKTPSNSTTSDSEPSIIETSVAGVLSYASTVEV